MEAVRESLAQQLVAAQAENERLREALTWIAHIADKNYEQDTTLRSTGARTLIRISDKARSLLTKGR